MNSFVECSITQIEINHFLFYLLFHITLVPPTGNPTGTAAPMGTRIAPLIPHMVNPPHPCTAPKEEGVGTVIVLSTAPLTVALGSIEVATGVDIEAHHRGEAVEEGMEEGMDATSLILKWIIVEV